MSLQTSWSAAETVKVIDYRIVDSYPHDPAAFTQGLYYERGFFYESTGLYGKSSLRLVEARSGKVRKKVDLPANWFGEGITVMGDKIVQLTWRSQVGAVYDKKTFRRLHLFGYPHEGWGITYDGQRLMVSDGTDIIRFWHPISLREIGRLKVKDRGRPLQGLNELEFIGGYIYSNVWPATRIVRIDPQTGQVTGELDLAPLVTEMTNYKIDVANGIAYDPSTKRLFVTGKFWPCIFVISIRDSE